MIWDSKIAQLPPDQQELARCASLVSSQAHARYSKFKVGAALRTDTGDVFAAANVENGSYGLTSCAERNAIFRAVAKRGPGVRWVALALVADVSPYDPKKPPTIPPCGACRQVLDEFKADDNAAVLFIREGQFVTVSIGLLLPIPFHFEPKRDDTVD